MLRKYWFLIVFAIVALAASFHAQLRQASAPRLAEAPQTACYLVVFGIGDKQPASWDGRVSAGGGQVQSIQGWRFSGKDSTDNGANWKLSTRFGPVQGGGQGPLMENGIILASDAAQFSVETIQGSFSFGAQEIDYESGRPFLNGRVLVYRVPATMPLTVSEEEQDFPAAAHSGDDVYVTYVEFVHGDRSQQTNTALRTEPANFDAWARPVGGDQVFLLQYSKSRRVWSQAMPVSERGQDVMRTAVAVDGQKRVWVFWSANREGNFDLYARAYAQGRWSAESRLTSDPGPDLNPVAATDARGRVWVAWQAFRNGNLEILAAAQNGHEFSAETTVSFSANSDWDPAIAAAPNGEVAVAWDTYDKGDYDVYFRRLRFDGGIVMEAPAAVAASQNFEARSSIAYDAQNRLWVAYEASEQKWGKDFGAYEKTGVALYQGHNLQVVCFQGNNRMRTAANLADSLPAAPTPQMFQRKLGAASAALNSFPRLATDAEGAVYLAFRASTGNGRSPVGSIWSENLVYFDGARWSKPILFPHTDGLLDSRPALLALAPGQLLMVSGMDHRQSQIPGPKDWINSDIFAAELPLSRKVQAAQLVAAPAAAAVAGAEIQDEIDQIDTMRNYHPNVNGQEYQLLRGEFHRHTEISGDGGRDGPLIDAYRYLIDAAGMDWGGCCDHDNGGGREYNWWLQQKHTDAYSLEGRYLSMFSYERSVSYPEGHRNVVFARRGVRPLPRLPRMAENSPPTPAPDTQMLYHYLKQFEGIVASHTSGTDMGTDWRDHDPILEPVVEIYQGDRQNYEMPGAPRSNTAEYSIGGWRPLGFVSLALEKGYRLGFQASSDHISTHMSYCNVWVNSATREGVMEAFRKRRVYGATENILADVRCGEHFMGEEFTTNEPPAISVKLWGTGAFARVHIIRNGEYVYTAEPGVKDVEFEWRDHAPERGKTSCYYVRGEQADGELVWVSPFWIRYE